MNTYTLESFINFCDDIQIAEESARQIKVEFKKEMKEIELLRKEAATIKGDIKKTLECYIKAEKILEQLQSKVNSMDVSTFDKAVSGAATIISIATGVGAAIGMNVFFKKALNESHAFTSMIVGSIAGGTVGKITKGARNRKYTKNEVLSNVGSEIYKVKICIQVLKNPKKYKKYLTDYTDDKLIESYNAERLDKIMPLMNKLINLLNAEVVPLLKELNCNGKFEFKNMVIYHTDEDSFSDKWSNGTPEEHDLCYKVEEEFYNCMKTFMKKYANEIEKFNLDIRYDNPDDVLTVLIDFE